MKYKTKKNTNKKKTKMNIKGIIKNTLLNLIFFVTLYNIACSLYINNDINIFILIVPWGIKLFYTYLIIRLILKWYHWMIKNNVFLSKQQKNEYTVDTKLLEKTMKYLNIWIFLIFIIFIHSDHFMIQRVQEATTILGIIKNNPFQLVGAGLLLVIVGYFIQYSYIFFVPILSTLFVKNLQKVMKPPLEDFIDYLRNEFIKEFYELISLINNYPILIRIIFLFATLITMITLFSELYKWSQSKKNSAKLSN